MDQATTSSQRNRGLTRIVLIQKDLKVARSAPIKFYDAPAVAQDCRYSSRR